MQLARPVIARHPFSFGRGIVRIFRDAQPSSSAVASDLRLFATTFAAGFLFVTVFIA